MGRSIGRVGILSGALILAVMLLLLITMQATATEQIHDEIIYNGLMGELETDWAYPSPLELYFRNGYPFRAKGTANYRGHIATWEIRDQKLYLVGIRVPIYDEEGTKVPLEWLFTGPVKNGVHAQWFTGMLLTYIDPYQEWYTTKSYPGSFYVIKYKRIVIVEVEKGDIVNATEFTDSEYWSNQYSNPQQNNAETKYAAYIRSFKDGSYEANYRHWELYRPDIPVDRLLDLLIYRPGLRTSDQSELMAWSMSRQLAGWSQLRQSFSVDDASVGFVNQFPKSLHVDLTTTNRGMINSIWWWNPLQGDRPQYTWLDLLRVLEEASKVVAQHQWMREWHEASAGRSLQWHVFGLGIGELKSDLEENILPVWREAGLRGEPQYSFYARNRDSWARLIFGKDDIHALVLYVSQPLEPFDTTEAGPTPHWLDSLPVGYDLPYCTEGQKSSKYAVVDPWGKYEIRTFKGCKKWSVSWF